MGDLALEGSTRADPRRLWLSERNAVALLLLATALILRSGDFFNPIPGDDEQYYLLIGQRLLDGALPYVDIWDRKPFGLFALIAGVLALGGDPFLTTGIAATLAAAATAFVITAIARRSVGLKPAFGAGVFYLAMLEMLGGDTIQTAVFYNLLVAGAALLMLQAEPSLERRADRWRAAGAVLLLGLALTIKTIAVFEATAIGLWLVARHAKAAGGLAGIRLALLCAAIGIAPTMLIGLIYAWQGAFDAWWFANFVSQLRKSGGFATESLTRLPLLAPGIVLLGGVGILGWKRLTGTDRGLLTAWFLAGFVQVFAIGNFWPMYALPLAVPAAVFAAHLFAIPKRGRAIFTALCLASFGKGIILDRMDAAGRRETVQEVMAVIPADASTTCLLGYNAPEIFYLVSDACLVSPYLFVDQLRSAAEANALPIDATEALREALARRPGSILTVDNAAWPQPNRSNDALIATAVARDYHRIASVPWRTALGGEVIAVWRRNDLPVR